jgi:hypothetical protein
LQENKDATSYRHKVIKHWDMISTLYTRDHAIDREQGPRLKVQQKWWKRTLTTKTMTTKIPLKLLMIASRKRYRSDDPVASMLGEKLDNFTAAFRADVSEPPPKPASPEEIWVVLGEIPDLEDDDQLAMYDVLVADDRKFKSLITLPQRMKKKKWVLKQIKT